jgi:hypothetical protein
MSKRKLLRMQPVIWIMLFIFEFCPAISDAQDFSKFCAEAQSFMEKNQPLPALESLRNASKEVWLHTPFQIGTAVLVQDEASGFGTYVAKPNNVYKSGDVIRLYLEPIGFTQTQKDNQYVIGLAVDFTIGRQDGTVIAGKENFGKWELKSHRFTTQFSMNLNYNITGVAPGDYVIKTILRDLEGSKTAVVSTPVRFE